MPVDAINQNSLSDLGLRTVQRESKEHLDQKDFLRLLTTQLKNQNPTEPKDGSEFLGQMAQFSSLDATQKMSQTLQELSDNFKQEKHLSAIGLIGKNGSVISKTSYAFSENELRAHILIPEQANNVAIRVTDANGNLYAHSNFGSQQPGMLAFTYPDNAEPLQKGAIYRIEATAEIAGKKQMLETEGVFPIESLDFHNQRVTAQLATVGDVPLTDIRSIL